MDQSIPVIAIYGLGFQPPLDQSFLSHSCLREHAFISMEREREREKGMHGREREKNRLSRFLQSAVNESKPPLGPGPAPIRRNNDWNRWLSGLAGLRKE
jgi:hypothetical protein